MKTANTKNSYAKKAVSLLLSFVMLFSIAAGFPAEAFAADDSISYVDHRKVLEDMGVNISAFEKDIRDAVKSRKSSVSISKYNIAYTSDTNLLYYYLCYNMPDVAAVADFVTYHYPTYYDSVKFTYHFSNNDYVYSQFDSAVDKLLRNVKDNNSISQAEKALLVHDRLASWAKYDQGYYTGSIDDHSYTMYGTLVKRTAVCQGFATTYAYLMNKIGIKTYCVNSQKLSHVWNIIYIDGVPYYVDVTWDNPTFALDGYVGHNNFLVSKEGLLATKHIASDNTIDYATKINGVSITNTKYDNYYWRNSYAEFQIVDNVLYYIDNTAGTLNRADEHNTVLYSIPDKWTSYKDSVVYSKAKRTSFELNIPQQIQSAELEAEQRKIAEEAVSATEEESKEPGYEEAVRFNASSVIENPYYYNNCSRLSSYGRTLLFNGSDSVYKYDIDTEKVSTIFIPNKTLYDKIEDYYSIFGFKYEDDYLYCYLYHGVYYSIGENKNDYLIKQYYVGEAVVQKEYTVSVNNDNNKGTVTGEGTYKEGTYVTLKCKTKAGNKFDGFYKNGNRLTPDDDASNQVTFAINENVTLETRYTVCNHEHYDSSITKQPTCYEKGIKTFVCSGCGYEYTEDLPIVDHNYIGGYCEYCLKEDPNYSIPAVTVPYNQSLQCVDESKELYVSFVPEKSCKVTVYTDRSSYKYYIYTYLYDGNMNYLRSCSYNENTNRYELNFFAVKGVKYYIGINDYYCAAGAFDLHVEYDTTSGHIHNYNETVEKAPTCTENGSSEFVCAVCGDTVNETVYAYGHSFKNNTCTRCGIKEYDYSLDNKGIATITKYNGSEKNIVIPAELDGNTVKHIGENAFSAANFESVVIPEGYISLKEYAFWNCRYMKTIKFPKSLQSISYGAFCYCYKLENIYIPENVESIDLYSFAGCSNIKSISVDVNNKHYDSRNNCNAVIETSTNKLIVGFAVSSIPHSVRSIEAYAFYESLPETVVIPKNIQSVGAYAFYTYSEKDINVCYTGSKTDWDNISFDIENEKLTGASIQYNTEIPACQNHSYFSFETTKQPTCNEEGTKRGICDACGYVYEESIPKAEHNYNTTVTAATCTEKGYTTYICAVCGADYVGDYTALNPDNHNFKEEITPATCTREGVKTTKCTRCQKTSVETIPAPGHTEVIDDAVLPTCTEIGLTKGSHCSVCGKTIVAQKKVKAKGHKEVTVKGTPATFKAAGKTDGKKCSVCGKVTVAQKKIAKLGAPSLSKVTAGSKQFKATWKSIKDIDGYEIQYSTSSSFKSGNKTVTVKGYKSTSKTVKSLKAKKKYYVRIRAYKTINGKKQYSSWSKSKSVTTKK